MSDDPLPKPGVTTELSQEVASHDYLAPHQMPQDEMAADITMTQDMTPPNVDAAPSTFPSEPPMIPQSEAPSDLSGAFLDGRTVAPAPVEAPDVVDEQRGVHDLRAPPHPASVGEQTAAGILRNLWTLFSGFAREYPHAVPDGPEGEALQLVRAQG